MMYILVGKETFPTTDINEWGSNRETTPNLVHDIFEIGGESISVSTVFLGIDHRHGEGEPVLFETMVFGGNYDGYQDRYCTYDEAVLGHYIVCEMVDKVRIQRDNKLNDLGI